MTKATNETDATDTTNTTDMEEAAINGKANGTTDKDDRKIKARLAFDEDSRKEKVWNLSANLNYQSIVTILTQNGDSHQN